MQKVGIVIDNYKLPLFEEALLAEDLEYTVGRGITKETTNIYVKCENLEQINAVAAICQRIEHLGKKSNN